MRKRRGDDSQREVKFELTPMIDVTFLILVFFMCTLKFKTLDHKLISFLPSDRGLGAQSQMQDPIPELALMVSEAERSRPPAVRRVALRSIDGRHFGQIVPGPPGTLVRFEPAGAEQAVRGWLRSCREGAGFRGKLRVDARSPHLAVMGALDLFNQEDFREVSYTGIAQGLLVDLQQGRLH